MTGTSWATSRPGRVLATLVAALRELIGLVLPVECGGCGLGDVALCPACAAPLRAPAHRVGVSVGPLVAWAVAPYDGPVRRAVVRWKDRGRHDLTGPLAGALARAVLALLGAADAEVPRSAAGGVYRSATGGRPRSGAGPPVLLVPVPSSWAACRRRGADVVLRLARTAARQVRREGRPVRVVPALRLARRVADQAGLGAAGRAVNLAGALRVRHGAARIVAGRACIVVDDVLTTGASAAEATRALAAAGARPLGVAATCATPLRRGLSVVAHLH